MPTQKKFLDLAGLIQLLQEIESLDETNIKDLYWSTDNADINPTVIFKVGDDNGSAHSIKKLTFKGDTSTAPTGATSRTLTITVGGVDKTITYYDTNNSTGLSYSYSTDTGTPSSATNVKAAIDRIINAINTLDPADEKVKQTAQSGSTALPILTAISGSPTSGNNAGAGYDTEFKFTPSTNKVSIGTSPTQTEIEPGQITLKLTVAGDVGQSPTNVTAEISAVSYNELLDDVESLGTGKQDKLTAGSNISFSGTGNTTINAVDEKVKHVSDTTTTTGLPMLFAGTTTNNTSTNVKFSSGLKYYPTSGKITVNSPVTSSSSVEITNLGITFASSEVGSTNVTINASNYGGTSAKATADGNGNNIVNTYATKAALDALTNQLTGSFLIVSTLPTADGTHGGIIYLIKDQEYGDTNSNIFKEYIEVNDGTTSSPSWKFELLGTTDAGVDVVTIPATGSNSVASLFAQYVTNA